MSRFYGPWISSAFIFLLWLGILALILWFQRQVLQAETDKEKVETEILRHAEKTNMLQVQVDNAQKDKENLQNEMEILLDRINKLSELVDKSRVNICRTAKFVENAFPYCPAIILATVPICKHISSLVTSSSVKIHIESRVFVLLRSM